MAKQPKQKTPKPVKRSKREIEAAGRAIGLSVACDLAAAVARRIVDIGDKLDIETAAKVLHALGMKCELIDANHKTVPLPSQRNRKAGKKK